jgi:hypothetical protein
MDPGQGLVTPQDGSGMGQQNLFESSGRVAAVIGAAAGIGAAVARLADGGWTAVDGRFTPPGM